MKLNLSPWFRDDLGPAAVAELAAGPDNFKVVGTKGREGYGVTLLRLNERGWVTGILANENDHRTAAAAIAAALARVREVAA